MLSWGIRTFAKTYKDGILPYNVPFDMNGGSAQFVLYPAKSFGIVGEVAGTFASNIGGNSGRGRHVLRTSSARALRCIVGGFIPTCKRCLAKRISRLA